MLLSRAVDEDEKIYESVCAIVLLDCTMRRRLHFPLPLNLIKRFIYYYAKKKKNREKKTRLKMLAAQKDFNDWKGNEVPFVESNVEPVQSDRSQPETCHFPFRGSINMCYHLDYQTLISNTINSTSAHCLPATL